MFSPQSLCGSEASGTFISASGLQNGERMYFCGFKPPSLWSFVVGAMGTGGSLPSAGRYLLSSPPPSLQSQGAPSRY